jgi:glycine cleavage system pyridoxal-binding protein P
VHDDLTHVPLRSADLAAAVPFSARHIGPSPEAQAKMLALLGYGSLDELVDAAVPETIRTADGLALRRRTRVHRETHRCA